MFDECDEKIEMPKHKITETQITNSSEVLPWGGFPKTTKKHTHNPRRLFGE